MIPLKTFFHEKEDYLISMIKVWLCKIGTLHNYRNYLHYSHIKLAGIGY